MADLSVSATFDLLGIEDLALGEGTFTRSTSTGGTQTITKINTDTLGFVIPKTPEDYGAVGDGVTDDAEALQEMFYAGGSIYIPDKVYRSSRGPLIIEADNTHVLCHGTIKLLSDAHPWPRDGEEQNVTAIINIRHCRNVVWSGGVLDGHDNLGPNGMALSHTTFWDPNTVGLWNYDIIVENLHIRNCFHNEDADPGGDTRHDYGMTQGGGKGITIQFGSPRTKISNCSIEDCSIGITYEMGVTQERGGAYVHVDGLTIADCFIGINIRGTYGATDGDDLGAQYSSSTWSNIDIIDCGLVGTQPETGDIVPGDFGIVQGIRCVNARFANLRITSNSGEITPFRGQFRNCQIDAIIDADTINNLWNAALDKNGAVASDTESPSLHNLWKVVLKVRGDGTSGDQITGDLIVDPGGDYIIQDNHFEIHYLIGDGANDYTGNIAQITTDFYSSADDSDFDTSNTFAIHDLGGGKWAFGHGILRNVGGDHLDGVTPEWPAGGYFSINNLRIENPETAGYLALRSADGVSKIGLRNNAGSTVCYADTAGLVVGSAAWDGTHLMIGGYHLWVESSTGKLRIKAGAPASDDDGTVVGAQTA